MSTIAEGVQDVPMHPETNPNRDLFPAAASAVNAVQCDKPKRKKPKSILEVDE